MLAVSENATLNSEKVKPVSESKTAAAAAAAAGALSADMRLTGGLLGDVSIYVPEPTREVAHTMHDVRRILKVVRLLTR